MDLHQSQCFYEENRVTKANQRFDEAPARRQPKFEVGDSVWLYIDQVREGLKEKLAFKWHGPFRILRKDNPHNSILDIFLATSWHTCLGHSEGISVNAVHPELFGLEFVVFF